MEVAPYDATELESLIESALYQQPHPRELESTQSILFSFGDTHLLSALDAILSDYLPRDNITSVLAKLRHELYAGTTSHSIQALHTIINNHKLASGSISMPKWNLTDPDIVFVNALPPLNTEDDQLFITLLTKSGFSSTQCSWTYIVRSPHTDLKQLTEDEEEGWLSYLFAELRIWKPTLICPIGSYPTEMLLGDQAKLIDRQGIIHWVGPWAVMPVYSPGYARRSEKEHLLKQSLEKAHSYCFDTGPISLDAIKHVP